jgi:hypothetical protein
MEQQQQSVFNLTSSEIVTVVPRSGWNPSFTPTDRLRWANLFVHYRAKGLTVIAAEQITFQKTYEAQLGGLRY